MPVCQLFMANFVRKVQGVDRLLTVNVGFSMGNEVEDSDKEVDEASAPSSRSSAALTEPRRAAEVQRAEAITSLNRILTRYGRWVGGPR